MGGSATNSGIDFQTRVATWFLVKLFAGINVADDLDFDYIDTELKLSQIGFETSEDVDDINLICENRFKIFVQVKTNVVLSASRQSDFYKAISQFVKQFIKNSETLSYFLLAVSPKSSGMVIDELSRVLLRIRLNALSFTTDVMSKAEKKALNTFKTVVEQIFHRVMGRNITNEEFLELSKRIFVSVIDIQNGRPYEKLAVALLTPNSICDSFLIWSVLIKVATNYASNRISVNADGIKQILKKYYKDENNTEISMLATDESVIETLFKTVLPDQPFASGKEVLLIDTSKGLGKVMQEGIANNKSDPVIADYFIVELFRFEDDCTLKVQFKDGKSIWAGETDVFIIYRAATVTGLSKLISEDHNLSGKTIVMLGASNDIDEVENSNCAKLEQKIISDLLTKARLTRCLHCSQFIAEANSLIVEIDEIGLPHKAGRIHRFCLRSTDRVIGSSSNELLQKRDDLVGFDIEKWVQLRLHGQGLINSFWSSVDKVVIHGWKIQKEYTDGEKYAIRVTLENGKIHYIRDQGIARYTKNDAQVWEARFNESYQKSQKNGDPFCYTSKRMIYGVRSMLEQIKADDEDCLKCKIAEIVEYTDLISQVYEDKIARYAPLCIVISKDTHQLAAIGGAIFLLTDPLTLSTFLSNWESLGIDSKDFTIDIVENDSIFDALILNAIDIGLEVLIDPWFDSSELVKGIIVTPFENLLLENSS